MQIDKEKLKVFEAFAGYGGASFGLRRAGIDHEVIGFSEVDADAILLYQYNFPDVPNLGDIKALDEKTLPDFDLFTGGFPCQPFSSIGKGQGFDDEKGRGNLFLDIIRICEFKQPKYILLENVSRLKRSKKHQDTFQRIIDELERIGYKNPATCFLNSKDYGIPQNRERLWIFAKLGGLPQDYRMAPPTIELKLHVKDLLDKEPASDLYRSEEQVKHLYEVHGARGFKGKFDCEEPNCFDVYNHSLKSDGICMAITPPEHNVIRIVEPIGADGKERVRKLSIDEHFRFMGFQLDDKVREIKYPDSLNYTKLGRRAGNGWDVNLVGILLKHLLGNDL